MLILRSRIAACASRVPAPRTNGFAPAREFARTPVNGVSHSSPNHSALSAARPHLEEIETLGRRCKEGDLAAWNLLFPRVWPLLVTFVHRLYNSFEQQDAEDVAQASLQAAVQAIGTFSGKGLFRAWLFGIAVRQAATFYRSSRAKKRGAQFLVPIKDFDHLQDEARTPAQVSADNDRAAILHCAINELPESDRDLVHLHFFGELTFREIADARNMNAKTVCTRLARTKEKLLKTLGRFNLTQSDG
jgi:RNA polymerase sigma-70 factor (ECF subfamily)